MPNPHLTIVPGAGGPSQGLGIADVELYDLSRGHETSAARIRRLQLEARLLAREEVENLERDMRALAARATEIAEGGDAYPVGVRELAARIGADLPQKGKSLMSLLDRLSPAPVEPRQPLIPHRR
jgi:hypothetical protein